MTYAKIILPKHSQVVLLEDSPMRIEWFAKRIPNLRTYSTVPEFTKSFDSHKTVDFIFLDHDLSVLDAHGRPLNGVGTGLDAAKFLATTFGSSGRSTLIHSWNRAGAMRMSAVLPEALVIPFGQFELEVEQ